MYQVGFSLNQKREQEVLFRRADTFRHMLMEDFRFMEAARMHSGEYEGATLQTDDLKPRQKLKNLMNTNPNGLVNFASYVQTTATQEAISKGARLARMARNKKNDISLDARTRRFNTKMSDWPPLGIWAHWILNTSMFSWVMVSVIVMNSLLVAADQELEHSSDVNQTRKLLEALDFLFLLMFVAEILLKWLDDFTRFWSEGWNLFDFMITSTSLIAPILDILFPETDDAAENITIVWIVKYLRIVRILRSLNVVTRIQKIEMIWSAVLRTFTAVVFITSLMFIFFYIFAIIGIGIFDRLSKSHTPHLQYRNAFATLENAFVTLFQLFTLDQYFNIIQETMQEITTSERYIGIFYILIWILLGSFIFNNIFVGVMGVKFVSLLKFLVNTFQNIRSEIMEDSSSLHETRRIANQLNIFGIGEDDRNNETDENGEESHKKKSGDPYIEWEKEIYHTLEVVSALGYGMSPTIWPRDTLFQYYMILEALASNADERNRQFRLLDNAIMKLFDT